MRRQLVFAIAELIIFCLPSLALDDELNANELINRAMQAQVAANSDAVRFQYFQKQLEKEDTRIYRIVESDVGDVQRLVAINDQELNVQQRAHEDQWLEKLLTNPSIQKDRQKDDAEEEARRQKIITVLGKAFLYEIEGMENEGRIVRLHFSPNPQFRPDSHEAKVCSGLEGTMWIDKLKNRFTRAEGKLVRGVDFGWGVLGHLNKGGRFAIEQTEVSSGVWRITDLAVSFKGTMLIFKSLNIRVQEHSFDYQWIPDHLSLREAVDMQRPGALHDAGATTH